MAAAGQNQIVDLLRALKRRRWQVAVPAVLITTLGTSFAVIVPKRYKLGTRIEINATSRVESDYQLRNPQEAAVRIEAPSAKDHVVHYARVKEIIEQDLTHWPEYANAKNEYERQLFLNDLLKYRLWASPTDKGPKSGTIFVDIFYSDVDKERAASFLSKLAQSWLESVFNQDVETLTKEKSALGVILEGLDEDLKQKEDQYYKLMELLDKDPSVDAGSANRLREQNGDWTFTSLDKAKTELDEVLTRLSSARIELEQARERFEDEPEETGTLVPVAAVDPKTQVEALETQISTLREDLARYRPGYSGYKTLERKIRELEEKIEELQSSEAPESERLRTVPNPRKAEYELAVRQKEDLVGQLEKARDYQQQRIDELTQQARARTEQHKHLADLENQVTEARLAANDTRRQWQQRDKSLQLLASSPTPWKIAQPPVAAEASIQPNPLFLCAVSAVLGLVVGMGWAVLSEYARSSYRTVADLASVMSVPVLGAIETILTRKERRRLQASRAIAGLSTAMIVGCIGWVTWIWYSAPERLPIEIQDAIERLRSALK